MQKDSPQVMHSRDFEAISCSYNRVPHRFVIRWESNIKFDIYIIPPYRNVLKGRFFAQLQDMPYNPRWWRAWPSHFCFTTQISWWGRWWRGFISIYGSTNEAFFLEERMGRRLLLEDRRLWYIDRGNQICMINNVSIIPFLYRYLFTKYS